MDVSKVTAADQTRSINWDLLEKIVVTLLLGTLATRMIPAAVESGAWQNWIILLAEGCVAFFVLIRRPTTAITRRPRDWVGSQAQAARVARGEFCINLPFGLAGSAV